MLLVEIDVPVEDDVPRAGMLRPHLEREGYDVVEERLAQRAELLGEVLGADPTPVVGAGTTPTSILR